jgi:hypothetical protein
MKPYIIVIAVTIALAAAALAGDTFKVGPVIAACNKTDCKKITELANEGDREAVAEMISEGDAIILPENTTILGFSTALIASTSRVALKPCT